MGQKDPQELLSCAAGFLMWGVVTLETAAEAQWKQWENRPGSASSGLVGTLSCSFYRLFSEKKKLKSSPHEEVKGAVCSSVLFPCSGPELPLQILGCHQRLSGTESLSFMLQLLVESDSPT